MCLKWSEIRFRGPKLHAVLVNQNRMYFWLIKNISHKKEIQFETKKVYLKKVFGRWLIKHRSFVCTSIVGIHNFEKKHKKIVEMRAKTV